MIDMIDSHIESRLKRVLFAQHPIVVYPYIPERDKKNTVYPCIGFVRETVSIDTVNARPECDLWIPSEETVSIDVQRDLGGGELEGPVSYTRKPYPTPVRVVYVIQAHATKKNDATNLIESLFQVFYPGYIAVIAGQTPFFSLSQPIDLDDLDIPLFCKAFTLVVSDILLDRAEAEQYQSIRSINFSTEA